MSEKYTKIGNLSVSKVLFYFINKAAIPGTDIDEKKFWKSFDDAVHKLLPKNNELLDTRHKLQMDIDRWHLNNKGKEFKIKEYEKFLKEIGYLKEEGKDFKIDTKNIDDEIAKIRKRPYARMVGQLHGTRQPSAVARQSPMIFD